jgi:phosphate transport system permease protein
MSSITDQTGAWRESAALDARTRKRHRAERRMKLYGISAICLALLFLLILLVSVVEKGWGAFLQSQVVLDVTLSESVIDPEGAGTPEAWRAGNYGKILRDTIFATFPDVVERKERRNLLKLVSTNARFEIRDYLLDHPEALGTTVRMNLTAGPDVDLFMKGRIDRTAPETDRRLDDLQIGWVDQLIADDAIGRHFNLDFFGNADSRQPEIAGIGGAIVGSFWTLLITLVLAFPIGVMAAIYLEEFAPKNRLTDIIEVNVNNLAAVPSIVFGLLGLAVFIQVAELPRSSAVVGGLTLMLMTLPTIIIATRAALGAVPPSIREAAYGVGASPLQVVGHHVLPLAIPGILTGTILGMARALGETAPLLMIGMVAFIVDIPRNPLDPATALPVQIFLWADSPDRGFSEKMAAAIIVLLVFLIAMNAVAIFLRRRLETRW